MEVNVTVPDDADDENNSVEITITMKNEIGVVDRPCPLYDDREAYFMYFIEFGNGTYQYTRENIINYVYPETYRAENNIRVSVNYIYGTNKPPRASEVEIPKVTRDGMPANAAKRIC